MSSQTKSTPLQNREAELGVIGCCIAGGLNTTLEAVQELPTEAFTQADCVEAFMVLEAMANQGKTIDLVTFDQEWSKLSQSQMPRPIRDSALEVSSPANLSYFTGIVLESHQRRQVAYAGSVLISKSGDATKTTEDVIAEAEKLLLEQKVDSSKTFDGLAGVLQLTDYLEQSYALHRDGKRSGIETGFRDLDRLIDGLQRGEQTIVAARPSMGKTAIGLNVIEHACLRAKIPAAFFTLEMSNRSLLRRLCSSWTKIPLNTLKTGAYVGNDATQAKIISFFSALRASPLLVHEAVNGIDSSRLCAAIRRLVKLRGIQLVVVDYLQKIKAPEKHEKRTYEVAQVSGALKAVAVQTGVALVTLAQLNRESEKDKKPRMPKLSDLADSGQIERDADTVALLHRSRGESPAEAKLIIAKQRDGELGTVDLHFNGAICRFENAARIEPGDVPNYDKD